MSQQVLWVPETPTKHPRRLRLADLLATSWQRPCHALHPTPVERSSRATLVSQPPIPHALIPPCPISPHQACPPPSLRLLHSAASQLRQPQLPPTCRVPPTHSPLASACADWPVTRKALAFSVHSASPLGYCLVAFAWSTCQAPHCSLS